MTSRQASETRIQELEDKQCDALIGVSETDAPRSVLYVLICTEGSWHRFCIDEGVLFLDETAPLAADEDIEEDQQVDLLRDLPSASPFLIEKFEFMDAQLTIWLSGGYGLQFTENADTSMMEVSTLSATQG